MKENVILVILAVLAVLAIAAMVAVILWSGKERRRITKEYEDAEDKLQERITSLSSEKAAMESLLAAREEYENRLKDAQENALKMQQEQHDRELVNMKDAFKALSAENSASFKSQSAETIAEILKPIKEKFAEFDRSVRESQKESAAQSEVLKANIETVLRHSQAVGDEARNLANALTGYSKVQGDFGEMLLTDVLKNAGLVEGIHFFSQGVITDSSGHEIKSDEGRTLIPDVMVYYPDDTTVIIDSKVSLNAYKEYMVSETVEARRRYAKAHVESVRKHVDELKTKDYASYIPEGRRKVNYNLMFIPVEGAFRLMLEEDPLLWQVAKDNNVLIVSQMTLVIVLNMIQMAWKQANQEKNIAEVYKTAEELMSQLSGWMSSYVKIGESLEKARGAYGDATKKLTESNQSVIKKIQKLEKLGLSPKKSQGRIKTSGRILGQESIIPQTLSSSEDAIEYDE
ncbi:MAG: DNA recombination protein RmuC [Bacteroidales bacterium]|nr:DNA recombination protein RmuC [Bacteroidales bacterium]MBQ5979222.1 DNA recombination protein RmuC [Bacteroidales bacterium]